MSDVILQELVQMSQYLGHPGRTYAILGEGNTSARIDENSFYVKASGFTLGAIDENGFVKVSIPKVAAAIDDESAGDESVKQLLKSSMIEDGEQEDLRPSVETVLHAVLLSYESVRFVGHTHPVFTNMILCSNKAEEAVCGRLCPDHIVMMGPESVFVPYVDPGLVMAREVKRRVERFIEKKGELPKAVMLQNHGLIAMGESPTVVTNITDMTEKMSHIIVGTYALGGPNFMSDNDVVRIHTRPDEKHRLRILGR